VLAKERSTDNGISKYLVGYYVLSESKEVISLDLNKELSKSLPDYMIPSAFVNMEAFPINTNGKLDKRALPNPKFGSEESYVAPQTDLEKALCNIWASVLGVEQVGITDHFFRIGGNSILAVKAAHRMSEVLGKEISVANIFMYNNIQILSEKFSKETVNSSENVEWEF